MEHLDKKFFYDLSFEELETFFIQADLPKYRAKQEAERQHRAYRPAANNTTSIMYVMLITISIVAVGWPTAMSFYWTISSLVNIVKALIIDQITSKSK